MLKYLIAFLLFVNTILAVSTDFIPKGQRAEIFELTDNEVATFRMTMPDDEFILLKEKANIGGLGSARHNLTDILNNMLRLASEAFDEVVSTNFFEKFPLSDTREIFPEFNIDDNGYAHLNKTEVLQGFDTNLKNYVDFDFDSENIMIKFFNTNKNFDIIKYSSFCVANSNQQQQQQESVESSKNQENHENLSDKKQFSMTSYQKDTEIGPILSEELLIQIENSFKSNKKVYEIIEESMTYINSSISKKMKYKSNDEESIELFDQESLESMDEDESTESMDDDEVTEIIMDDNISTQINNTVSNGNNNDDVQTVNNYKFKTKNVTMTVELGGKTLEFEKVTLSLGGQYSRQLQKPNFNLKIRGKKDLYGRSQFKLRSDYTEPTFLRSKLTSDIHNRLGLTSISANYAVLYINNENMGFFVLTDAIKKSWVEHVYGEQDTTSLYQCRASNLSLKHAHGCKNEDDDFNNYSEWIEFLDTIEQAQSAADIEDIFDVDHFITEMIIEYLIGGWDHIQLIGHNFYMYKEPNGKWKYISYDFDHEFGINIDRVFAGYILEDLPEHYLRRNTDYPNYSFSDWTTHHHILEILIFNDPSRFEQILKEVVEKAFNPATLFPHIDELKEFIRPYVEMDKTPNENGEYPGRINPTAEETYSLAQWDANSEFTTVKTIQYNAYGLKYWILAKYRFVCKNYNLDCDPTYLDENYEYPINKEVEFEGYFNQDILNSIPKCEAEKFGFICCPSYLTEVQDHDEYGDWSYDYVMKDWCIIRLTIETRPDDEECWANELGYKCCYTCEVQSEDDDGKWGIENNEWCGISTSCNTNQE